MRRRIVRFIGLACCLLLVSLSGPASGAGDAGAAPRFEIQDIAGAKFSLEAFGKTGGVTVVSFWGLRCGACLEEIPYLNRIQEKFGGKVRILGVNTDGIDAATLSEQIRRMNLEFKYLVVPDPEMRMAELFDMKVAPLTIIIGADGNVRHRHENFEAGDEKEMEKIIGSLAGPGGAVAERR